jgi:transposase
VRAPEHLRRRLRGLSTKDLLRLAARFRLGDDPHEVPTATKFALRSVARRYEALSSGIDELEVHLDRLVGQVAPELVALPGIGTDSAATLLIVAGDNPQRLGTARPPSPVCAGSHPSKPPPPARCSGIASTEVATGRPTVRCT